jgi:DNA-binding GntR family transcriptional regulator
MDQIEALGDSLVVARAGPTLRQRALDKLRAAIIDGRLAPGSRLVERKLCDSLGVSRPIVRESLRQLEAEGWVINPPYKGPTVAVIGEEEARQIFEMRVALEGHAARMCASKATADQVSRLEATVDQMSKAQKARDVNMQIRMIELFYEVLMEGAGNKLMANYLVSQRSRLARLRLVALSRDDRAEVSVEEKRGIVAAIRARDAALAQRLGEEHVENSAKIALAALPSAKLSGVE